MIYLTVNDQPSGVYKSQVVDVVEVLNQFAEDKIKLVCLISFRGFFANRKQIKKWYSNSLVLPMIPGIKRWKQNELVLRMVRSAKNEPIIARGVMAHYLAARLNANVIYDGRGATKAELTEYPDMISYHSVVKELINAECVAVLNSKFRIAVSHRLVEYWEKEFGYTKKDHIVIPCLIEAQDVSPDDIQSAKNRLGYKDSDIIMVYAGGIAGWQSFSYLVNFIKEWLQNKEVKLLFLSQQTKEIDDLKLSYPNQICQVYVAPEHVQSYLSLADYGLLIREDNITNQVSSPVKFAEYLYAGLSVIISQNIGDYSDLVAQENLGAVLDGTPIEIIKMGSERKAKIKEYAETYLSKNSHIAAYKKIFDIANKS